MKIRTFVLLLAFTCGYPALAGEVSPLEMMTLPYVRTGMILSIEFSPAGIVVHEKSWYRLATFFASDQKAKNYQAFIVSQPLMAVDADGLLIPVFNVRPRLKCDGCMIKNIKEIPHSPPIKEIKSGGFYIVVVKIEESKKDSFEIEMTYSFKGALSSRYAWYPFVESPNYIPPALFERGSYRIQISAEGMRVDVENLTTHVEDGFIVGALRSFDHIPLIKLTPQDLRNQP